MHAPENSSYRILVADDEPHIRQILRFTLERAGYQVYLAADGEDALKQAAELKPNLVLLDVMMPKVDGYEVCRKMRQDFSLNQIPVIMLSARGEQRDRVAGLEGGANDYLVKPYSNEELLLRVRNVLEWNIRQKEANPLTGLPGNTAIEREMIARIAQKKQFAFLYIDIDNFKGLTTTVPEGRRIIGFWPTSCGAIEKPAAGRLIGHIGGDDFVLVAPSRAEIMAQYVVDEFDRGSLMKLDPKDVKRGYLEIRDRQGELKKIPVMAVTIALVKSTDNQIEHFAEVSDIATSLKEYGKRIEGSVVVKERRQDGLHPSRTRETG
jgi:CheY-like chemotaxis protein